MGKLLYCRESQVDIRECEVSRLEQIRYLVTTVMLNGSDCSEQYHSMNSRMA